MTDVEHDLLEATARSVLRIICDMTADRGTEWKDQRYFKWELLRAINGQTKEKYPQIYSTPKLRGSMLALNVRPSDTVSPQD